ncbi:hypothetical protein [Collinsella bouchesdurhonensis]|uniref:hypothetical protein n=1 Tax=Collinsella bouchesdurhonensis TaxID=1907654 RepID=UPI0035684B43
MTYFNPEIYDPAKLTGDERLIMDGFDTAVEEVESFFVLLMPPSGVEALDRLYEGVAEDLRDELLGMLAVSRIELTCSLMENTPEKYDE